MPATLDRSTPLCRIHVYAPGHGDPVLQDRGFAWYDDLSKTFPFASSTRTTPIGIDVYPWVMQRPLLEYIKDIGVVCKGYLSVQNTRSSHFTTSGGTWEEVRPATGLGFKYRYFQVDTTADLQWAATTIYNIPENPEFAISLSVADTPSDHDAETYPPYVRVEFGGDPNLWAFEWSKVYGGRLLYKVLGSWRSVAEINELERNKDTDEAFVFIRCLRNRICISHDFGRTWDMYGDDETPLTVQAGKLTFRGQGNAAGIGIHKLDMAEGVLTSTTRNTFTSRLVTTNSTITGRYTIPTGANIVFADASSPTTGVAQYTATLTPATTSTVAFTFCKSPELYSVTFKYPVVRYLFSNLGYNTQPFENLIYDISIDKPFEMSESSANIHLRIDPDTNFSWNYGVNPKLQIELGWFDCNGEEVYYTAFTGYIVNDIDPHLDVYRGGELFVQVDNVLVRFKETEWSEFDRRPLGGQTLNQALDEILDSEGLQATDRLWHVAGDYLTLPAGLPEDPFEFPARGEKKFETMKRIAGYFNIELSTSDDGRIITVPRYYYNPSITFQITPDPSTDISNMIKKASYTWKTNEMNSAVLVYGKALNGAELAAYAVDFPAENNPTSPRFTNWRRLVQEDLPNTANLGMCVSRAQAIAQETMNAHIESTVEVPATFALSRRDQGTIAGMNSLGISEYSRFVLLSIKTTIKHDPSWTESVSELGLRQLNV